MTHPVLLPGAERLLALPRVAKRALALAVDAALCVLTVWLAFYLRLDEWLPLAGTEQFRPLWAAALAMLLALPLFVTQGFYRVIFRHADTTALATVLRVFAVYALAYGAVVAGVGLPGVPRSVGVMQPLLLLLTVGGMRVLARYWLGGLYQQKVRRLLLPKVLVYGAGNTGRQLAAALATSPEMQVVGFLDDDDRLHGHVLQGVPVYNPHDLTALVDTQGIRTVLLAMPSITRQRRNRIIEELRPIRVAVRTLPSLNDMVQGRVSTSDLHELDIDDLLGRESVPPNHLLLGRNVAGKVVMVTGAGGSIGSELCRQIVALAPARLLLVEHSEFALYAVHEELQARLQAAGAAPCLVPLLASVQDATRMQGMVAAWRPHTVYHAAAYKHVPLVEHNPAEGVKNNVLGTLRTAQAAAACGVADFVLVSTDKAVRPTNTMGASKRLAEMVLQALAPLHPGTRFSMVRFGNVLGSSGSVVPKFRQQIRDGGPITLTHPEVTRYFMTIPEAAQLVIQAGAMAKGGDVFVLDMGQPVKIARLARRMVELSGLTVRDEDHPGGDIALEVTGLRPGEKLYEELLIGNDPQPTTHPKIMKAHEACLPWPALQARLQALEAALASNDLLALRQLLLDVVDGFQPTAEVVDWVHLEQSAGG